MSGVSTSIRRKQFEKDQTTVFEDFDFDLQPGEIVSLIGPSGIGKSTLLNILAGLDTDFDGQSSARKVESIGTVFQTPRLMPWLTVRENIELVCQKPLDSMINDILQQVELDGHDNKYPGELSGGMQRRASLARAFVNRPPVLLLDEPFVSLDEPSANRLRQLLIDLWQIDQPAVLFVTHDLREAITLGDKLVFLGEQPAKIVLEKTIEIPRPRSLQGSKVRSYLESLMQAHPDILSGIV